MIRRCAELLLCQPAFDPVTRRLSGQGQGDAYIVDHEHVVQERRRDDVTRGSPVNLTPIKPKPLGQQVSAASVKKIECLAHPLAIFDGQPATLKEAMVIKSFQPLVGGVLAGEEEALDLIAAKDTVLPDQRNKENVPLGDAHTRGCGDALVAGQRGTAHGALSVSRTARCRM